MTATIMREALRAVAEPDRIPAYQRFFKTGKGEYGEGDIFIGVRVPVTRLLVKKFSGAPLCEVEALLQSTIHEERVLAVLLLVDAFAKGDADTREEVYTMYLANTRYINNWDIVDSSAHYIVGQYLFDKKRKPLYKLARSRSLWERRIAMVATFYFIRQKDFADTFGLAEILLHDSEDLIHKAVGWMLREVGNRNRTAEEEFLVEHYKTMPRIMLRYAIEKFPEGLRLQYLLGMV